MGFRKMLQSGTYMREGNIGYFRVNITGVEGY